MRKYIAIIICKLAKKICKYFGRGSSFPGQLALKICPDILSQIELPENIIAVTGSNGKTSTVEMIHGIIEAAGMSLAYNYEGSNQIEGVTTLVLSNSSLSGRFNKDVLLIEADERYAKHIFSYITPKYYVINNLYRDQMTRNGHPEYVLSDIRKSIHEGSILILNADDPLVSSLGTQFNNETIYFGIEDNQYVSENCQSIYDDGFYCPVCKKKMVYEYRQFAHVGKYECPNCGFRRQDPAYVISDLDLNKGTITINDEYTLDLAFNTIFNAYNVLASFAATSLLGIRPSLICEVLNDYLIRNGRIKTFKAGEQEGTLLISKHENTVSYDRNLEYVSSREEVTLLLIIDDISRKYFTSDTSWLWDIRFEYLNNEHVKKIVIAGKYISDVAIRLEYAGIDMDKVVSFRQTHDAVEYLKDHTEGQLFALTCFSDEGKLLKEVTVQ
jgi:UDP-N-acetylmuramyl tripeptide synthase